MSSQGHKHSTSLSQNQNHKARLANAYNELSKELSSHKVRVVGNYTLGKVIGEGTYGKVRLGTHRLTSIRVAIKQIPKDMTSSLTREIHHHRRLHHPHITQLYEVIATESNIWLVTELCSGGELFDYLVEKGRLSEDEARSMFGQLCLAVGYIHDQGIVHRDLKLENVLLDERCRVKLGDFGFTREFERGAFLDTYCGTTGYAAPEMLQGKKYLGPEVDVWSLGIILYCLLTGALPFDDDDETQMHDKIIIGKYEDPAWLPDDARDLIRNVLQQDPQKRLTISQILQHKWFTNPTKNVSTASLSLATPPPLPSPAAIESRRSLNGDAASEMSDSSFHSASSEWAPSSANPYGSSPGLHTFPNMDSQTTIKSHGANPVPVSPNKSSTSHRSRKSQRDDTTPRRPKKAETLALETTPEGTAISPQPSPGTSPAGPGLSGFPTRTPVRTKRRSVSSVLSQPSSPTTEVPPVLPQDYTALLTTPPPLLFSTPLERSLLNSLSHMGFDTGQMVHSVLSDACDASSAVWWMLKRRAERKALEDSWKKSKSTPTVAETDREAEADVGNKTVDSSHVLTESPTRRSRPLVESSQSAPELAFVPPTPTAPTTREPTTPPRSVSPRQLLSPTPTSGESIARSTPSTPGGSSKDGSKGRKDNKPRSGSVSIISRATTALEAAGIVRKKSTEAVKDKEEKDRGDEHHDKEKGSHTNRLTKSPPLKAVKDHTAPSTPDNEVTAANLHASPWVMPGRASTSISLDTPTATDSMGDSTPTSSVNRPADKVNGNSHPRNRSSILSTFRTWFNDDRKGKRKAPNVVPVPNHIIPQPVTTPTPVSPTQQARTQRGAVKRRGSGRNAKFRGKRPSVSSRRSSSVNSRRSSAASMQMVIVDSPIHNVDPANVLPKQRTDPSRRSFTPNSELDRADFSSRPSSVHSFTARPLHKKSPSESSTGSGRPAGATSPLPRFHKRHGSGSSTRVVRQSRPVPGQMSSRPSHGRSNSATSSIHSLPSSRPTSFYDLSDAERTGSPLPSARSRYSQDDTPRRGGLGSVLVAHKKSTPLVGPSLLSYTSSASRSSWKKAWGNEPPGWSTRSRQLPVEIMVISQEQPNNLRDVFSTRQSLPVGDEDDWVDEDDDITAFVSGFGQGSVHAGSSKSKQPEAPILLSPPPRHAKRAGSKGVGSSNIGPSRVVGNRGSARSKAGHSPAPNTSVLPSTPEIDIPSSSLSEGRVGRRQLPNTRSGPAFRQAIQEEDEDEE